MATKKELIAQEVARAVGAGKAVALETVISTIQIGRRPALRWIFPSCP